MRFFDPLQHHRAFLKEQRADWKPNRLIRRAAPKAPLWRSVACIAFIAAPALVAAMLQAGLPVRAHPLEPDRYVVPHEAVNEVTFRDLIRHPEFIYLATVIFVTSGTSQTSPADWDNSNNTIEGIGGGASGGGARGVTTDRVSGGGGGEYRKISNFSVATPGTTSFAYTIGAGGTGFLQSATGRTAGNDGTQTTFNTTSLVAKPGLHGNVAATGGACAGGAGGTGGTGAAGNADGGAGGATTTDGRASGAGGAGGPNGAGVVGVTGVGGAGGDGDASSGGAGGAGSTSGDGAATSGGNGTEWDASHGSGGGGGAKRSASTTADTYGGAGGLYGGGSGSSLHNTTTFGAGVADGAQGIIVMTYTPTGGAAARYFLTLIGSS